MNVSEIAAMNDTTLEAIRKSPGQVDRKQHPFYGYFTVDIFDCQPFVMFTNDDCPIAEQILYRRRFEPKSMQLWCRLARTATAILDIGANVGVYSLAAAALRPDLAINAFEPNPHAFARLRMHRKVNSFDNIVEHYHALGSQTGIVDFGWRKKHGAAISTGGAVGTHENEGDTVERTVTTMLPLDKIMSASALGDRGLVKIDVEGAEGLVFKGMQNTLKLRPDIILETFDPKNCDIINSMILPLGYRVYLIQEDGHELDMIAQDRLRPRDRTTPDFNQFLTPRPIEDIKRQATDFL